MISSFCPVPGDCMPPCAPIFTLFRRTLLHVVASNLAALSPRLAEVPDALYLRYSTTLPSLDTNPRASSS